MEQFLQFLLTILQSDNIVLLILKLYFCAIGIASFIYVVYLTLSIIYASVAASKLTALLIPMVLFIICWFPESRIGIVWISTVVYSLNSITLLMYCLIRLFKNKKPVGIIKTDDEFYPAVAVIFPVKDEEFVIAKSIKKVLELDYPKDKLEIIVIDDHSTDKTQAVVQPFVDAKQVTLYTYTGTPGKASALNYVLPKVRSELILILDGDHLVPKDYLKKIIYRFKDPKLGLVQGMFTIRNGNESLIARLVELEYHAFYQVFYAARILAVYLGTGAIFRKKAMIEAGDFNNDICTEDCEMSFRIHQLGYEVLYSNEITTYELAPTTLKHFFRQRYRWIRGTWQAFYVQFKNMMNNSRLLMSKKLDFLQFGITPFILFCYIILNIFFALDVMKLSPLPFNYNFVYLLYLAILIFYTMGLYWSKKLKLIPFVLLVPLFYMVYSFACLKGLVDEFVLSSKFKGVKAEKMDLEED